MKKIISFLMLMVTIVPSGFAYDLTKFDVTTNVEEPITYVIESQRPRYVRPDWYFNGINVIMTNGQNFASQACVDNNRFLFYFTNAGDSKYYIHPYNANGKVLGAETIAENSQIIVVESSSEKAIKWTYVESDGVGSFTVGEGDATLYLDDKDSGNPVSLTKGGWATSRNFDFGRENPVTLKTVYTEYVNLNKDGDKFGTYVADDTYLNIYQTASGIVNGWMDETDENIEILIAKMEAKEGLTLYSTPYVYALKCTDANSNVGYFTFTASQNTAASFSDNASNAVYFTLSPTADKEHYNIKEYSGDRFIGCSGDNVVTSPAYDWTLEPVGGESKKYYIRRADGKYLGNGNIGSVSGTGIYTGGDYTNNTHKQNCQWELVPMTKTISITDAKAATLFSADGLEIPAGVTAKYVKTTENEGSEGALKYTELEGIIPANTAVVLTGEAGDYAFKVNTTEVDAVEDNALFGHATATTASDNTNIYALANKSQGVGFYPFAGTTYTAGKAYLDITNLSAAAEARFFNIFNEDNETAIESIEGTEGAENTAIYDLSGRRVQSAQKGLYIMNGRIVIK